MTSTEVLQPTDPTTSKVEVNMTQGCLKKRGPRPLRVWQKRFLNFENKKPSYQLRDLKLVYRKNVRRYHGPQQDYELMNKYLFDTIATATVSNAYLVTYYKGEEDQTPQGLINLRHIESVEAAPKIKPFCLLLRSKARDYYFTASNKEEMNNWIGTFQKAIETEFPDYSNTEAYKATYKALVDKTAFLKRADKAADTGVTSDQEIFSASETEFETEKNLEPVPVPATTEESKVEDSKKKFSMFGFLRGEKKSTEEADQSLSADSIPQPEEAMPVEDSVEEAKAKVEVPFEEAKAKVEVPFEEAKAKVEVPFEESKGEEDANTEDDTKRKHRSFFGIGKYFQKEDVSEEPRTEEEAKSEELKAEEAPKPEEAPKSEEEPKVDESTPVEEAPVVEEIIQVEETKSEGGFLRKLLSKKSIKVNETGEEITEVVATEEATEVLVDETPAAEEETPVVEEPQNSRFKQTLSMITSFAKSDKKEAEEEVVASEEPAVEEEALVEVAAADTTVESEASTSGRNKIMGVINNALSFGAKSEDVSGEPKESPLKSKIEESNISGFINKRKQLINSINKYFFILDKEGILTYYKDENSESGKAIDLNSTTNIVLQEESTKLAIECKYRTYRLEFKDSEEAKEWYAKMKEFIRESKEAEKAEEPKTE